TATAGHDGFYSLRLLRSGYQSGRCARAGPEISEVQFRSGLSFDPVRHKRQTLSQQIDVEPKVHGLTIDDLLVGSEQVDKQRPNAAVVQHLGDVFVSRAVTTASAPMREYHQSGAVFGNMEIAANLGVILIARHRYGNQSCFH